MALVRKLPLVSDRPAAKATGNDIPLNRISALAITAGTTPSWPWAKLTMRFAR